MGDDDASNVFLRINIGSPAKRFSALARWVMNIVFCRFSAIRAPLLSFFGLKWGIGPVATIVAVFLQGSLGSPARSLSSDGASVLGG
jgi:hypothetical protein